MKKIGTKLAIATAATMAALPAMAQVAEATTSATSSEKGFYALAAALAIAPAVIGGGLGQGKTASVALEGIARNPAASGKLLVAMILGLALIESLVIYALLIALKLTGKLG